MKRPLKAGTRIGILDLEIPRELVEVADVPEDHVPIAAKVERQQVIVAHSDEELARELSHRLGHGGQATSQHLVQILIGVLLRVQERVLPIILPGHGRAGRRNVVLRGWGPGVLGQWLGNLTSMKDNSTAGTPAKAVKEYALLSMGRGRILGADRLEASEDSGSPQPPPPVFLSTYTSASQLGLVSCTCSKSVCPLWLGESTCGSRMRGTRQAVSVLFRSHHLICHPQSRSCLACFRMFSMRLTRRGLVLA